MLAPLPIAKGGVTLFKKGLYAFEAVGAACKDKGSDGRVAVKLEQEPCAGSSRNESESA